MNDPASALYNLERIRQPALPRADPQVSLRRKRCDAAMYRPNHSSMPISRAHFERNGAKLSMPALVRPLLSSHLKATAPPPAAAGVARPYYEPPANLMGEKPKHAFAIGELLPVPTHGTSQRHSLMRVMSGLGMEDPVYGRAIQKQPSHPSHMFDDMGFDDVPRDMTDLISIASDPTATAGDGLDIDLFQASMGDLQLSTDFSLYTTTGRGSNQSVPRAEETSSSSLQEDIIYSSAAPDVMNRATPGLGSGLQRIDRQSKSSRAVPPGPPSRKEIDLASLVSRRRKEEIVYRERLLGGSGASLDLEEALGLEPHELHPKNRDPLLAEAAKALEQQGAADRDLILQALSQSSQNLNDSSNTLQLSNMTCDPPAPLMSQPRRFKSASYVNSQPPTIPEHCQVNGQMVVAKPYQVSAKPLAMGRTSTRRRAMPSIPRLFPPMVRHKSAPTPMSLQQHHQLLVDTSETTSLRELSQRATKNGGLGQRLDL